jgi:translocation and assembly module TamB
MNRRALKITAVVLGSVLLLLAGLAAATWGISQSQAFRAWLLDLARQEVLEATGAKLEIASIEGNLFVEAEIKGLALVKDGRRLLDVKRLRLRYNLLALLGGRLRIGHLEAVAPQVNLPWELTGGGEAGPPLLAITLGRVIIKDGGVVGGGLLGPVTKARGVDASGSFSLDTRGLRAQASIKRGRVWMQGLSQPLDFTAKADLNGQTLKVPLLVVESGPNRAQVSANLNWEQAFTIKAQARAKQLQATALPFAWPLPERPQEPLDLDLEVSGPLKRLQTKARLTMNDSSLDLEGWLNTLGGALEIGAGLKGLDFARWGLGPLPLAMNGKLRARANAWPGLAGSSLNLEMELDRVRYEQTEAGPLRLQAKLQEDQVTIDSLALESAWGSLQGQGQAKLPGDGQSWSTAGSARFSGLTPPPILAKRLPKQLRSARLSGEMEFKGDARDLTWEVKLGPSHAAPGLDLEHMEAKGGLSQGRWLLRQLSLDSALVSLEARGEADLTRGEMEFSLRVPDLAELERRLVKHELAIERELGGDLSAKGKISGPWLSPDLSGELQVKRPLTRHAWAQWAEASFDLKGLGKRPRGWARLETRFLISGEVFLAKAAARADLDGDGQLFTVEAHGPELSLGLSLASRQLFKFPIKADLKRLWLQRPDAGRWAQRGVAQVVLGTKDLKIKGFSLAQGEQRLDLDGTVDPVSGVVEAQVNLRGLALANLLKKRFQLPAGSRLDASGELRGSLSSPQLDIKGRLRGLAWPGVAATELRFQGDYAQERLSVKGKAWQGDKALAQMEARLGFQLSLRPPVWETTHHGLSLKARAAELPLAMLAPLLPGVSDLRGTGRLNLDLSGSLENPQAQGRLEVDGGSFSIDASGQRVEKIEALITLKGRKLLVERCSARAGGSINLSGGLELPLGGPGSLDLKLQAQGVQVSIGTLGQLSARGQVRLSGDFKKPVLSGTVYPSQIMIAFTLNAPAGMGDVVILKPGQAPPPLEKAHEPFSLPPVLDPLAIDLTAVLVDPTRISLADGWLDTRGSVTLKKAANGPLIFGKEVVLDNGLIILLGKRFQILQGGVAFRDRPEPNPDLAAEAQLNIGSTTVFINVSGTAQDPELNLSSLPPMSQADILSTIIFGRPANKLSSGQSQELSAQALALLGAAGKQEMEKLFGPDLTPDVVTVHNAPSTGSSLEAGKYLSEELYLRYRQNLGVYGGQSVGLEYRFSRTFSVESQVGNSRDSGVDLVFTKDFDFSRIGEPEEEDKAKKKTGPKKKPGPE